MSVQIIKLLFLKLSGGLYNLNAGLKNKIRNRLEKRRLVSLVCISHNFSFLIVLFCGRGFLFLCVGEKIK